jgi:hypothetical protein
MLHKTKKSELLYYNFFAIEYVLFNREVVYFFA